MKPFEKSPEDLRLARLHEQRFSALNQLAAGTAHEFNNIIAGIFGSAELLALDVPQDHPAREALNNIFEASRIARDYVTKLRELAQRHPADFKKIYLQNIVEDSLTSLRTIVAGKVTIDAQMEKNCPPVYADAALIQQMLIELCVQCWHGLPDRSGEIRLTLEVIALHEPLGNLVPGNHVRLTVRDNGPGLDAASLQKVFAPFVVRRSGGKKIGLELFAVREMVHLHRGEIIAASEPGSGLSFQMYLPAVAE